MLTYPILERGMERNQKNRGLPVSLSRAQLPGGPYISDRVGPLSFCFDASSFLSSPLMYPMQGDSD